MINNGKAKIQQTADGLTIIVPSKKNRLTLGMQTLWLLGRGFGFVRVIDLLSTESSAEASNFLTVWAIGWAVIGLGIIIVTLRGYFGKEKISIVGDKTKFQKVVFGVGKKETLDTSEVKNFRIELNNNNPFNPFALFGFGVGKVKFDYGLRTYSFGSGLDDAEATHIVDLLKKHI